MNCPDVGCCLAFGSARPGRHGAHRRIHCVRAPDRQGIRKRLDVSAPGGRSCRQDPSKGNIVQSTTVAVLKAIDEEDFDAKWVYTHTDRNAGHRYEHYTARQRLFRYLNLAASSNRELRGAGPCAQRFLRWLHAGRVALRQDHRTDRAHSRLCSICRPGRCRNRRHAAPGRICILGSPASGHRVRMRRYLCHDRELA